MNIIKNKQYMTIVLEGEYAEYGRTAGMALKHINKTGALLEAKMIGRTSYFFVDANKINEVQDMLSREQISYYVTPEKFNLAKMKTLSEGMDDSAMNALMDEIGGNMNDIGISDESDEEIAEEDDVTVSDEEDVDVDVSDEEDGDEVDIDIEEEPAEEEEEVLSIPQEDAIRAIQLLINGEVETIEAALDMVQSIDGADEELTDTADEEDIELDLDAEVEDEEDYNESVSILLDYAKKYL